MQRCVPHRSSVTAHAPAHFAPLAFCGRFLQRALLARTVPRWPPRARRARATASAPPTRRPARATRVTLAPARARPLRAAVCDAPHEREARWATCVLMARARRLRAARHSVPCQHVQCRDRRHGLHSVPVRRHQPVRLDGVHVQRWLLRVRIRRDAGLHRFVGARAHGGKPQSCATC